MQKNRSKVTCPVVILTVALTTRGTSDSLITSRASYMSSTCLTYKG